MILFLPAAKEEMIEAARFYESREEGLGFDFLDEVEEFAALVLENPQLGEAVSEKLRKRLLRRFPFSLIYHYLEGTLTIVSVAHTSRKPFYWKPRE